MGNKGQNRKLQVCESVNYKSGIQSSVLTESPNGDIFTNIPLYSWQHSLLKLINYKFFVGLKFILCSFFSPRQNGTAYLHKYYMLI